MADRKCGWCEDQEEGHTHYAVLVRENGKLLGRLTPEGGATNRNIFAAILSKARAEEVAKDINAEGQFEAKAIKF